MKRKPKMADQGPVGKKKKTNEKEKGDASSSNSSDKFEIFYGKAFVFSQFHPATFTVDGLQYTCMEQYMHHQKAVTFGDTKMAEAIMATTNPVEHKKLGRLVSNFDKDVWSKKSVEVVKKGSLEKYRQNLDMRAKLFATSPRTLVEASPRDRLWGIGMGSSNPAATDPSKWRGKNLLGYTLTEVRDQLMKEDSS